MSSPRGDSGFEDAMTGTELTFFSPWRLFLRSWDRNDGRGVGKDNYVLAERYPSFDKRWHTPIPLQIIVLSWPYAYLTEAGEAMVWQC